MTKLGIGIIGCGNISTADICPICSNPARAIGEICVVEDVADLWAMERGQAFRGRYHVLGGTLSAIEAGFIQRAIQDSAYKAQQEIDSATAVVVGVNKYQTKETTRLEVFRVDPALEHQQVERLRQLRASRSASEHADAIAGVEKAAKDGSNLMPTIIDAVEKRATLGEIANTLRGVFGEYREQ